MNRYEPSIPRVAFGIAAVAMTAITIGVSVVIPAKMDSGSREPRMLAASKVDLPASTGVVAGSASIDVVAVHDTSKGWPRSRAARPNRTASQKAE
jgi:hypothetical protein